MPVEIREIVLQARVLDQPASGPAQDDLPEQLAELRHQMLAECEQMVRAALDRRSGR